MFCYLSIEEKRPGKSAIACAFAKSDKAIAPLYRRQDNRTNSRQGTQRPYTLSMAYCCKATKGREYTVQSKDAPEAAGSHYSPRKL